MLCYSEDYDYSGLMRLHHHLHYALIIYYEQESLLSKYLVTLNYY